MRDEEEVKNVGSSSKCVRLLCSSDDVLNQILQEVREIKTCMGSRLTSLELKISLLVDTCNKITSRLDAAEKSYLKNRSDESPNSDMPSAQVINLTNIHSAKEEKMSGKLKLIPLSSESDFPNGSWLGDPKSPSNRVRCHISPQDLFHINSTCFTPEKMALCLLDYLFPREELAVSNISGRSRWGKKQLDPYLIYGIKCHLKYKFFITEKDWHKICQNIDAKCRFAWKRSHRMNQSAKSKFKTQNRRILVKSKTSPDRIPSSEDINFDFEHINNNSSLDFNNCVKVITQSPCELRILNATPAQIAHLQESQEIILAEEMLPSTNDSKRMMINNNSEVSMNTVVMDGVVEELGSDLTIQHDSNHSMEDSSHSMDDSSHSMEGAKDRTTHHRERLAIHDSHLETELKLEVELDADAETRADADALNMG